MQELYLLLLSEDDFGSNRRAIVSGKPQPLRRSASASIRQNMSDVASAYVRIRLASHKLCAALPTLSVSVPISVDVRTYSAALAALARHKLTHSALASNTLTVLSQPCLCQREFFLFLLRMRLYGLTEWTEAEQAV
jgi:hypothetical protein